MLLRSLPFPLGHEHSQLFYNLFKPIHASPLLAHRHPFHMLDSV